MVYQLLTRIMLKKKGKVAGFKLQGIKTKLQYGDSLVMTQNRLMRVSPQTNPHVNEHVIYNKGSIAVIDSPFSLKQSNPNAEMF